VPCTAAAEQGKRRTDMTAEDEVTVDTLRPLARRAGLQLTDEQLEAVLPGVRRNIAAAAVVRKWGDRTTEPQVGHLQEGASR
jgi:hypothetical protein